MQRRPLVLTWKVLIPLWAGAVSASIFFGSWVGAQVLTEDGITCEPTELLYTRIHDYPAYAHEDEVLDEEDTVTPDAALDDFLKKAYPKLNKSEFKKTKHDGGEANFKKEKDGRTVAEVVVQKVGPSWEIGKFTACNSVAQEGAEEGSEQ